MVHLRGKVHSLVVLYLSETIVSWFCLIANSVATKLYTNVGGPGGGIAVFVENGSSAIIKTTMFEANVDSLGDCYDYIQ